MNRTSHVTEAPSLSGRPGFTSRTSVCHFGSFAWSATKVKTSSTGRLMITACSMLIMSSPGKSQRLRAKEAALVLRKHPDPQPRQLARHLVQHLKRRITRGAVDVDLVAVECRERFLPELLEEDLQVEI